MSVKTYIDKIPGYRAEWDQEKYTLAIFRIGYSHFEEMFTHVLTEDDVYVKMQKFYKEYKQLKLIK